MRIWKRSVLSSPNSRSRKVAQSEYNCRKVGGAVPDALGGRRARRSGLELVLGHDAGGGGGEEQEMAVNGRGRRH